METHETGLQKVTQSLASVMTSIPAPLKKNFLKALGQLCTAAVDVPVAWLQGKAAEIRSTTAARVQIISTEGDKIAEKITVPEQYIAKASEKFASKIIKEQLNLDNITLIAAKELTNIATTDNEPIEEHGAINDDWLNEFETLARLKSSEDMQLVFGKILSGEITKPGSYSIRTVRLISQLDNEAAKLFQILCSHAIVLFYKNEIVDARVVSLKEDAGQNSLSPYGLSYRVLNLLEEYGLIYSEYNSYATYNSCIANENNKISATLRFQNVQYGLVPTDRTRSPKELQLNGVALTQAGRELLTIIPLVEAEIYKKDLVNYFENLHLKLVPFVQVPT